MIDIMSKKKTHDEFINELNKLNSNIKVIGKYKTARESIKVKCLKCTGEWEPTADSLLHGHSCPFCCHTTKKILIGFNDMWTINSKLAKLLANKEDGYKYTQGSGKRVDFKCPNCGHIVKNKIIRDISLKGFNCPKCGDGISYPEKFMFNTLKQILNKSFQTQLSKNTFKWCGTYRYDFYIPKLNCIVETQGSQHYKNSTGVYVKTLEEEQENDKNKKELALNNNIINYIEIDCRYSELDFIKNNIIQSELSQLLKFKEEDIDWLKCHEYACSSLVKIVCDLWDKGIKILKILQI